MRADRIAFGSLALVVFAYVIARACRVPFVHDEAVSLLWYVQPGEWLPYHAHWDASNHYLSSGCGVLGYRLFGEHRWAVRWASAAAFVLYAAAAWRTGHEVRSRSVRWCLWAALLLCPFALDLFSLFRGYAIELAAWMWALSALLRYARTSATTDQCVVLVAMIIGTASIIALVPVWLLVLALLALLLALKWKALPPLTRTAQSASLLLLGGAPLYYAARLAMVMKEKELLYHGSTEGFIPVTVAPLARFVIGSDHLAVIRGVLLIAFFAGAIAVRRLKGQRSSAPEPLVLVVALIACDVLLRIVLARVAQVNYPEDRAGIHYVPLVVLSFAYALDACIVSAPSVRYAAVLLLWLPLRTITGANMDHTLLWPEQSVPDRFLAEVAGLQAHAERPLSIGGYHQLPLSWQFNARYTGNTVPPLQTALFPSGAYDLCVVDERFPPKKFPGYAIIDSATGPGLWLLQRTIPMNAQELFVRELPARSGAEEFVELIGLPDSLTHASDLLLEVIAPFTTEGAFPQPQLILEENNTTGAKLVYDGLAFSALRSEWNGDTLHVLRRLPQAASATRAVLYIYNERKQPIAIGAGRIRVFAMR